MKKAMIVQPMNGLSDDEIKTKREEVKKVLESKGYSVMNSFFDYSEDKLKSFGYNNLGIFYLSESLKVMSMCDAIYCCKGWDQTRGCTIEHQVAEFYGLEIIYSPIIY